RSGTLSIVYLSLSGLCTYTTRRDATNDWDLFVGIMWARFGTPTSRAGSGTEEEFGRAIDRYRSKPASVGLLFYFKDAPIAPSKIDIAQLQRVQDFQRTVRNSGVLTWEFSDAEQFEKLLSLHITKHVQEWKKAHANIAMSQEAAIKLIDGDASVLQTALASETTASEAIAEDDSGYLDLLEKLSELSADMSQILTRLTEAQQSLTENSIRGREELDQLQANPANFSPKKARASIARVADEMLKFTGTVKTEIPNMRSTFDSVVSTLIKLVTITSELYPDQLDSAKVATQSLRENVIAARQTTEGLKDSTERLPRMTKELNLAKRRQVAALAALISEYENGERLLAESLAVIDDLTRK
ncbi:MAG: hypothetical protein K2Y15_12900, partial [Burkholderiaceae bacterium]|nr:hypothetical protein [Burkholderiaceae bacterium]